MRMISPGDYELPKGHTVVKMGSYISIKPIVDRCRKPDDHRCIECAHRISGRWSLNVWYKTFVCEEKPKRNSDGSVKEGLFYAVKDFDGKGCLMFKKK